MLRLPFGRWAKKRAVRSNWKSAVAHGGIAGQVHVLEERTLLTATAQLVKDINTDPKTLGSAPESIVRVGSKIFFRAQGPTTGFELYVSDGTEAGTVLLKDIYPGPSGSLPMEMVDVAGTLYFTASDGGHIRGIWKSDGTAAGTVPLGGSAPFVGGPRLLTNVNGTLYFMGGRQQLWKTDGTDSGTVFITAIPGLATGSTPESLTNVNGTLFVTAMNSAGIRELWKSDGTEAGTVQLTNFGSAGGVIHTSCVNVNGTFYFAATDLVAGTELWKSDGTAAGTIRVKDISPTGDSAPEQLTNVGGTLFFSAIDGAGGRELWKSDGTEAGTVLVADLFAGPDSSSPTYLTDVLGTVYFVATDATGGAELWTSDGTAAGTVRVKDIVPGTGGSDPRSLTAAQGRVFFKAETPANGRELWVSDGTETGTFQVKDISTINGGSWPRYLTAVDDIVYFQAGDASTGGELWRSDGTEAGTRLVKDIRDGNSSPEIQELTRINGTLFFTARVAGQRELWKSDGTAAGTVIVKDIPGSLFGSAPSSLTNVNGTLYFSARDMWGFELWKSDGTDASTVLVKDIRLGGGDSSPQQLRNVNGVLFFTADDGSGGRELWKSDGTAVGTVRVKDIVPGSNGSDPRNLLEIDGELYFTATDATGALELWKSDGTEAGTVLVKEILPAGSGSSLGELTNVGGFLYLIAADAAGYQLWKSDGTDVGTVRLKDFIPTVPGNEPQDLTDVNGVLYFTAYNSGSWNELWKSDGTVAGTVLVKDILPGSNSSYPGELTVVGGTLFFKARDNNGWELWKSDGTGAGTARVKDIWPGLGNADPRNLIAVDGILYFFANDGVTGDELWRTDGTSAGTFRISESDLNPTRTGLLENIGSRLYFVAGSEAYGDELWSTSLGERPTSLNLSAATFAENQAVGTPVGTFVTADADPGDSLTYALVDGAGSSGNASFTIVGNQLMTAGAFNFEGQTTYSVRVRVTDSFGLSLEQGFVITVTDVDEFDTTPLIDTDAKPNAISENSSAGPVGLTAFASDADGSRSAITYTLIDSAAGRFLIDSETGIVILADDAIIDYETASSHSITVLATSDDGSFSEQSFTIQVADVDEFNVASLVDIDSALSTIPEHSPAGTPVGITAFAQDLDGTNNQITYSLWNTRGGRFAIDPVTGVVSVANGEFLDREVQATWTITVLATSQDGSVSVKEFTIELDDVNEFKVGPLWDLDPAPNRVLEHSPTGTPVGISAFAIDLDATNSGVTYSLWDTRGGRFAINPVTGLVTVANGEFLDREARPSWTITVLATSHDGSISVKEFTVDLVDIDEFNVGQVFDVDAAANTIVENSPEGTPVGVTGFGIDLDATNSDVTYSLWNTRGGRFGINPTTGVVAIANGALIDREVGGSWTITILATSSDGSVSVKDFTIAVRDVDEHDVGQVFDLDPAANSVSENAANGTAVGITGFGIDLDATNSDITYSLADTVGGRFAVDSSTGVVTVANPALLDREAPGAASFYDVTVRATSQDGSTSLKVFTIQIIDENEFGVSPITDVNPAGNTVTENATAGTLIGITARATDGDASDNTVTYSLTNSAGGSFQIDPVTGVVSVAAGAVLDFETQTSHDIAVQATSADGSTSSQSFTIDITNLPDARRITLSSNTVDENRPGGTVIGVFGTVDVDVTSPAYRLVGGAGSTDNSKFQISGNQLKTRSSFNFEVQSSYSIRVQMRSAGGVVLTQVFTIQVLNVNEGPTGLTLSPATIPENNAIGQRVGTLIAVDPDAGDTLSYSLVAGSGSTDNARFTIEGNELRAAEVFDYERKRTYSVRVRVTDAAGLTYEKTLTVSVGNGPA